MIDHTLLRPDAARNQIRRLCSEAMEYRFHAVCVNPLHVSFCRDMLEGSGVNICTVAGFPLGASISKVKALEAETAESQGANEIDMVINIGALKDSNLALVADDIAAVVKATSPEITTKVIIETCYLNDDEKTAACKIAVNAGADFVKTSTGFGPRGATVEDVALIRRIVGNKFGVKAAGGIRDYETLIKMIEAGANRIGTSASALIMNSLRS